MMEKSKVGDYDEKYKLPPKLTSNKGKDTNLNPSLQRSGTTVASKQLLQSKQGKAVKETGAIPKKNPKASSEKNVTANSPFQKGPRERLEEKNEVRLNKQKSGEKNSKTRNNYENFLKETEESGFQFVEGMDLDEAVRNFFKNSYDHSVKCSEMSAKNEGSTCNWTYLTSEVDKIACIRGEIASCETEAEKVQFQQELEKKIQMLEEKFQQMREACCKEDEARYFALLGELYSCSENRSAEAAECIQKGLRKQPEWVDTWGEVGMECLRRNDLHQALTCFDKSLEVRRTKEALRNKSRCLQLIDATEENIREAIRLALEALHMDETDSFSLMVLGQSLSAAYFVIKDSEFELMDAILAYGSAVSLAKDDDDHLGELFANMGLAFNYSDMHEDALAALEAAKAFDPDWDLPGDAIELWTTYLEHLTYMDHNKGGLEEDKLKELNLALNSAAPRTYLQPYYENEKCTLKHLDFDRLEEGPNEGEVTAGVLLWTLKAPSTVPASFGLMDRKGGTVVVTIKFMLLDKTDTFKVGDIVAIPFPTLAEIDFSSHEKSFKFKKINVHCPETIAVNNKLVPEECIYSPHWHVSKVTTESTSASS